MAEKRKRNSTDNSSAASNDAANFWIAIDQLRGHVEISEFKHFVLGALFLRTNSAEGEAAAWRRIIHAEDSALLSVLDEEFAALGKQLGFSISEDFRRIPVDHETLRGLIAEIDRLTGYRDSMTVVFGYCLEKFAHAEARSGAEFYTPKPIVDLLVKALSPSGGTLYDPCCGGGGLLAEAWKYHRQSGAHAPLSLFGQESNPSTWRLCKINLEMRDVKCALGTQYADSFRCDLHTNLRADTVLANPPFNLENWCLGEAASINWTFGTPPPGNANFAWIQHIIHHLSARGMAAFTMGNGALASTLCGEGDIRRRIIEADYVDCIIALPPHLFHTTRIPASIWILAQEKSEGHFHGQQFRARHRQTLFIDAQRMGRMIDRVHRTLDESEVDTIAATYRAWRGSVKNNYSDVPGFCRSCTINEISANQHVLAPGRYVGGEQPEKADEDSANRIAYLAKKLDEQFKESSRLERVIRERMVRSGYEL